MNELELLAEQEQETITEVISMFAQGGTPAQIHSKTGVPPARQREIRAQWQRYLSDDAYAHNRAKTLIGEADEHYKTLIGKLYEVVETADDEINSNSGGGRGLTSAGRLKKEAIKEIAELERLRIEFFQRAGVIGQAGIGDQIAEAEERIALVVEILKETAKRFPAAAKFIAEQISKLNGQTIATRVVDDDE